MKKYLNKDKQGRINIQPVQHCFTLEYPQSTKSASKNEVPGFETKTGAGDVFYRLSAYRNDARIGADGEVVPGAYATTEADIKSVSSGFAAVKRYALPCRLPAIHVFIITPPPNTDVVYGEVASVDDLTGGGSEAYFPSGCCAGSAKYWGRLQ